MCLVIDPGGSVDKILARIKDRRLTVKYVVNTHDHIDHSNDVNVLIDAMTGGGLERRVMLFAPSECLDSENAVILPYLRGFVQDIGILKPKQIYHLDDVTFTT